MQTFQGTVLDKIFIFGVFAISGFYYIIILAKEKIINYVSFINERV